MNYRTRKQHVAFLLELWQAASEAEEIAKAARAQGHTREAMDRLRLAMARVEAIEEREKLQS